MTRLEVIIIAVVVCGVGGLIAAWATAPRAAALRQECLAQLGEIGKAVGQYLEEHGDRWPYVAKLRTFEVHDPPWPTLPVVLAKYIGDQAKLFACPADRRILPANSPLAKQFPIKTTWFATEGTSYEWMWSEGYGGQKVGQEPLSKAGALGGADRADQPLLADFDTFHDGDEGGTFNTLFADLKARPARAKSKT